MGDVLSPAQQETLRILHAGGAVSFETGLPAYNTRPRLNPNVTARLEGKGLTASKVRRLGRGHQMTLYWLTPAGSALAAALGGSDG